MVRKVWCYQCKCNTVHYLDYYEVHNISHEDWICEECGQEASDRSHNDWAEDDDISFLEDEDGDALKSAGFGTDEDYGGYGLLGAE